MPHETGLISILALGFGLALIFGFIAQRLRLPTLVGYLLAGVVIGPHTPGVVADIGLANQLAEIGVMLLMFGVGLHFSLNDLLSVKKIALPGAIVQILAAMSFGMALGTWWGWSLGASLVFGLCLSTASTVVLLRALESNGIALDSVNGRIAVGWLIVEDLAMVLTLVLLPVFAGLLSGAGDFNQQELVRTFSITFLKLAAFAIFMMVFGRKLFPKVLWWVASTGSRELFSLCVIAFAIAFAFGATALFGVSVALGAFFAGMMLRESEFSHRAADESLPLRDAFAVLFFVSVGMLFNPEILWHEPLKVFLTTGIVVAGKTLAAIIIVLVFRYPLNTALIVGVSLAQIGEFAFILAGLGMTLGLMSEEGLNLILAAALISIILNPAFFFTVKPLHEWMLKRSRLARQLNSRDDPLGQIPLNVDQALLKGQAVIVGYGSVGKRVGDTLMKEQLKVVIAEQQRSKVDQLRQEGKIAVSGDASEPNVLIQAHIMHADVLIITIYDLVKVHQMIQTARTLNPEISILVCAHNVDEAELLRSEEGIEVFNEVNELADSISRHVLGMQEHSAQKHHG